MSNYNSKNKRKPYTTDAAKWWGEAIRNLSPDVRNKKKRDKQIKKSGG